MQVQQEQVDSRLNSTAYIRERGMVDLQEAVSRYLPPLYKRAYRYLGNPHDAEDAVQDALLSAFKHLDQFKGSAQMTTWLTVIVTNCALIQLRRRPRHPHVSLDERFDEKQDFHASDRLADTKPGPEHECLRSEMQGLVMQHIAKLSPALRKVIQLRVLDGLTTSEAADILGVSYGTVKAQVSRARSKLKRMMRGG